MGIDFGKMLGDAEPHTVKNSQPSSLVQGSGGDEERMDES